MTKPLLIATAVGSLAIGFGVGYKVAEKRLEARFDERLQKETEGMKTFYSSVKQKYASPEEAVADLIPAEDKDSRTEKLTTAYHKIVQSENYQAPVVTTLIDDEPFSDNQQSTPRNIFNREIDKTLPYIISQEEFMQNDPEYHQDTLTYFPSDDVLADANDDVINDKGATVGLESLVSFGVQSSDENIVHVRNERLGMDFEIVKSEGSYMKEVFDSEEELPVEKPSARIRRERHGS